MKAEEIGKMISDMSHDYLSLTNGLRQWLGHMKSLEDNKELHRYIIFDKRNARVSFQSGATAAARMLGCEAKEISKLLINKTFCDTKDFAIVVQDGSVFPPDPDDDRIYIITNSDGLWLGKTGDLTTDPLRALSFTGYYGMADATYYLKRRQDAGALRGFEVIITFKEQL